MIMIRFPLNDNRIDFIPEVKNIEAGLNACIHIAKNYKINNLSLKLNNIINT